MNIRLLILGGRCLNALKKVLIVVSASVAVECISLLASVTRFDGAIVVRRPLVPDELCYLGGDYMLVMCLSRNTESQRAVCVSGFLVI